MARLRPVREGPIAVVARARGAAAESARCRRLLRGLRRALKREHEGVELLLTGDAEQRALNRRLRGRDRTTDVLSFPAGSDLEPGRPHLGEIAISLPQAARQARAAGWPTRSELALLVTHGLLHLAGYDHETDDGAMHRLEARLLERVAGVRIDRRALPWGNGAPAGAPRGRRREARHG